jgi:hypothetical protein
MGLRKKTKKPEPRTAKGLRFFKHGKRGPFIWAVASKRFAVFNRAMMKVLAYLFSSCPAFSAAKALPGPALRSKILTV